jgi:hypothetical protein
MAITRVQAREITTADEQDLVYESFHPTVRSFSADDVKQRITRARRLRDKYRDLAARQEGQSKRRGRGGAGDNARTRQKARLFGETLDRLEKRLASLESAAEPEAASSR